VIASTNVARSRTDLIKAPSTLDHRHMMDVMEPGFRGRHWLPWIPLAMRQPGRDPRYSTRWFVTGYTGCKLKSDISAVAALSRIADLWRQSRPVSGARERSEGLA
jgi:hypothetical protein